MVSRMKGVLNSPPLTLLPGGRNYQSDQENKSSQRTRTLGRRREELYTTVVILENTKGGRNRRKEGETVFPIQSSKLENTYTYARWNKATLGATRAEDPHNS